jgi:hypothetical protein
VAVSLLCAFAGASAAADQPQGSMISPAFVKKTNKLCATIDAKFTRVLGDTFPYPNFNPTKPDHKTLLLVGKYFAKALPLRRAIPGEFRGLGEPAVGTAVWDAIRSLVIEDNAVAIKQVAAAQAGDAKTFVSTYHRLRALDRRITIKASTSGFPQDTPCGFIF